jgi:hypothetical protein
MLDSDRHLWLMADFLRWTSWSQRCDTFSPSCSSAFIYGGLFEMGICVASISLFTDSHSTLKSIIRCTMLPYLLISCLLAVQWRRSVAFWKALVELYRLGVSLASLDDFLPINPVKKGVRKPPAASKSSRQPGFHIRGPNLTKIQMTTIRKLSWISID